MTVGRAASIQGSLRAPSDKSLTHRAYLFGAIASGESVVKTPLKGEDCESTLRCLVQMGLKTKAIDDGVRLFPASEWRQPEAELDCGNSGTTMRLLAGLVASRDLDVLMTGDASLSKRPMKRIAAPLREMGAEIVGDTPPLRIRGGALRGIRYDSPIASAQVKSCVLLAGLNASGATAVREPELSRDHTERMLAATGVKVRKENGWLLVEGGSRPNGFEFSVPGDLSSAAFFMVAAAMVPGSKLDLYDVGVNPTRSGLLDVFDQVGVEYFLENQRNELGEPVADIQVRATQTKEAFVVEGPMVPRLIDEAPILAVLATQCAGISVVRDARELRVKESDRIELIANGLRKMGAQVETREDGFEISGPTPLSGATIDAEGDHRIAMAFAIAGLIAKGETHIEGAEAIATSYPAFESDLARLTVV